MRKLVLSFVVMFSSVVAYSQVGIGTLTPDQNAQLEVKAEDKGILIPRVRLTSLTDRGPIRSASPMPNSLLVFNLTTNSEVKPGYYYWFTDKWQRVTTEQEVRDINTINQSLSFRDGANGEKILVLKDSDDREVAVGMKEVIESLETLTALTYTDGVLVYTDEDKQATRINLKAGDIPFTAIDATPNADGTPGTNGVNATTIQQAITLLNQKITEIQGTKGNLTGDKIIEVANGEKSVLHDVALSIKPKSITADKIADGTITSDKIDSNAIKNLETLTVLSYNNSILSYKDEAGNVTNIPFDAGNITFVNPPAGGNNGGTGDNGTGDNGTGDNGTGDNGTGDNGTGGNNGGTGENNNPKTIRDVINTIQKEIKEIQGTKGTLTVADFMKITHGELKEETTSLADAVLKNLTISVKVASSENLGVVKQAKDKPTVQISEDGVLSVNTTNITDGLDGGGITTENVVINNPDGSTTTVKKLKIDAENGIHIDDKDNKLKLGGDLTKATEITTTDANTLAIKGLQDANKEQDLLVMQNTDGVLRKHNTSEVVKHHETKTSLNYDKAKGVLTYVGENQTYTANIDAGNIPFIDDTNNANNNGGTGNGTGNNGAGGTGTDGNDGGAGTGGANGNDGGSGNNGAAGGNGNNGADANAPKTIKDIIKEIRTEITEIQGTKGTLSVDDFMEISHTEEGQEKKTTELSEAVLRDLKLSVKTATADNLGVVKQAKDKPTVEIAEDGTLSVNTTNITDGLDGGGLEIEEDENGKKKLKIKAKNGIKVDTDDYLKLGGALTEAETKIEAAADKTLAISGLQVAKEGETDVFVVQDATTSVLRKRTLDAANIPLAKPNNNNAGSGTGDAGTGGAGTGSGDTGANGGSGTGTDGNNGTDANNGLTSTNVQDAINELNEKINEKVGEINSRKGKLTTNQAIQINSEALKNGKYELADAVLKDTELTVKAGNGLAVDTNENSKGVILGGTLDRATELVTDNANTLAIKGLQDGAKEDVMVVQNAQGVLKKRVLSADNVPFTPKTTTPNNGGTTQPGAGNGAGTGQGGDTSGQGGDAGQGGSTENNADNNAIAADNVGDAINELNDKINEKIKAINDKVKEGSVTVNGPLTIAGVNAQNGKSVKENVTLAPIEISISPANGTTLGVVKQAEQNPTVEISADGVLSVNTTNITDGLNGGGLTIEEVTNNNSGTGAPTTTKKLKVNAKNGINVGTDGFVKLGGDLTEATTITTTADNTLAIKDLQKDEAEETTNLIVVQDPTSGVLKNRTLDATNIPFKPIADVAGTPAVPGNGANTGTPGTPAKPGIDAKNVQDAITKLNEKLNDKIQEINDKADSGTLTVAGPLKITGGTEQNGKTSKEKVTLAPVEITVATANGTALGVVKQAETDPTVTINDKGELAVNTNNIRNNLSTDLAGNGLVTNANGYALDVQAGNGIVVDNDRVKANLGEGLKFQGDTENEKKITLDIQEKSGLAIIQSTGTDNGKLRVLEGDGIHFRTSDGALEVSASQGLTATAGGVQLGGTLTEEREINVNSQNFKISNLPTANEKHTKVLMLDDQNVLSSKELSADNVAFNQENGAANPIGATNVKEAIEKLNEKIVTNTTNLTKGSLTSTEITVDDGTGAVFKNVTLAIAQNAVTENKLAPDAVTTNKIKNGAVIADKIGGKQAVTATGPIKVNGGTQVADAVLAAVAISVDNANGTTLGVVKEAAQNPSVKINAQGELSVDTSAITGGLAGDGLTTETTPADGTTPAVTKLKIDADNGLSVVGGKVGLGGNLDRVTTITTTDTKTLAITGLQDGTKNDNLVVQGADGVLKKLAISSAVSESETLTTLAYTNTTGTLTYTAENKQATAIDLKAGTNFGVVKQSDEATASVTITDGIVSVKNANGKTQAGLVKEADQNPEIKVADGILTIADEVITGRKIANNSIEAEKIKDRGNITGSNGITVTSANNGNGDDAALKNVTISIDSNAIGNNIADNTIAPGKISGKQNLQGDGTITIEGGTGAVLSATTVKVTTANGTTLGVVKQAATSPTVLINNGELSVNTDNIKETLATDLAGAGLVKNGSQLDVQAGDGIVVDNDRVKADLGAGLTFDNGAEHSKKITLDIQPNSGLAIVGGTGADKNKVRVLEGDGVKFDNNGAISVLAENGLTATTDGVKLGGTLKDETTTINVNNKTLQLTNLPNVTNEHKKVLVLNNAGDLSEKELNADNIPFTASQGDNSPLTSTNVKAAIEELKNRVQTNIGNITKANIEGLNGINVDGGENAVFRTVTLSLDANAIDNNSIDPTKIKNKAAMTGTAPVKINGKASETDVVLKAVTISVDNANGTTLGVVKQKAQDPKITINAQGELDIDTSKLTTDLPATNGGLTTDGGKLKVNAKNGINVGTDGFVKLGGALTEATTITTDNTNTLTLAGLQQNNTATKVVVTDDTGKVAIKSLSDVGKIYAKGSGIAIGNEASPVISVDKGKGLDFDNNKLVAKGENGITIDNTKGIILGGALTQATTIGTTADKTLTLAGLQQGGNTDTRVLVTDNAGKVAYKEATAIGRVYTAENGVQINNSNVISAAAKNNGAIDVNGGLSVKRGNGIDASGDNIAVKPKTNGGILVTADGVAVNKGNGLDTTVDAVVVKAKENNAIKVTSAGVEVSADSGVEINGGNVRLGGTLERATTITTSSANTLTLAGLQPGGNDDARVLVTNAAGKVTYKNATDIGKIYEGKNGIVINNTDISADIDTNKALEFTGSTEGSKKIGVKVNNAKGMDFDNDGKLISKNPWNKENSSEVAYLNTGNIYHNGNVGIGGYSSSTVDAKLHIKGGDRQQVRLENGSNKVDISQHDTGLTFKNPANTQNGNVGFFHITNGGDLKLGANLTGTAGEGADVALNTRITPQGATEQNGRKQNNSIFVKGTGLFQGMNQHPILNDPARGNVSGNLLTTDVVVTDNQGTLYRSTLGNTLSLTKSGDNAVLEAKNPWNKRGTTTYATDNDANIYRIGRVAIGRDISGVTSSHGQTDGMLVVKAPDDNPVLRLEKAITEGYFTFMKNPQSTWANAIEEGHYTFTDVTAGTSGNQIKRTFALLKNGEAVFGGAGAGNTNADRGLTKGNGENYKVKINGQVTPQNGTAVRHSIEASGTAQLRGLTNLANNVNTAGIVVADSGNVLNKVSFDTQSLSLTNASLGVKINTSKGLGKDTNGVYVKLANNKTGANNRKEGGLVFDNDGDMSVNIDRSKGLQIVGNSLRVKLEENTNQNALVFTNHNANDPDAGGKLKVQVQNGLYIDRSNIKLGGNLTENTIINFNNNNLKLQNVQRNGATSTTAANNLPRVMVLNTSNDVQTLKIVKATDNGEIVGVNPWSIKGSTDVAFKNESANNAGIYHKGRVGIGENGNWQNVDAQLHIKGGGTSQLRLDNGDPWDISQETEGGQTAITFTTRGATKQGRIYSFTEKGEVYIGEAVDKLLSNPRDRSENGARVVLNVPVTMQGTNNDGKGIKVSNDVDKKNSIYVTGTAQLKNMHDMPISETYVVADKNGVLGKAKRRKNQFYMPSVVLPTTPNAVGSGNTTLPQTSHNNGTYTVNLHALYKEQFEGSLRYNNKPAYVKSAGSSGLQVYENATELEYYVVYYDTTVFDNVQISETGVLTYTVKANARVTERTYMNIVFQEKW